jgi:hypothetical protein
MDDYISTQSRDTMADDGSRDVNILPVAASSGHGAGIFAAAHNFTIANSQLVDVHGNYIVCDNYCVGENTSLVMITLSKSTILQFLLK